MVYEMLHLHFRQGKVRGVEGGSLPGAQTLPGHKGLLFPVSADSPPTPAPSPREGGAQKDLFKNLNFSWEVGDGFMCPRILPALKAASEKFVDRNESIAAFLKKMK